MRITLHEILIKELSIIILFMRGWFIIAFLLLVPIVLSIEGLKGPSWLTNATNASIQETIQESNYTVRFIVTKNINYSYKIENDTLYLWFSVQRGNPCQYLTVEYREIRPGYFDVYLYLLQRNKICIQVVPKEPATANISIPLNLEQKEITVRVTMKGIGYDECWRLREQVREALMKGNLTEAEQLTIQLRERCGWNISLGNKTHKNMTKEEIEEILANMTMIQNRTRERMQNRTVAKNMTEIMNWTRKMVGRVEVIKERGKVQLRVGNLVVDVKANITVEGNQIRTRVGVVRVMPDEVVQKLRIRVRNIQLVERERPVYIIECEKEGRLLGIFPIRISVTTEVDAETGAVIKEKKPWWAFLVFG